MYYFLTLFVDSYAHMQVTIKRQECRKIMLFLKFFGVSWLHTIVEPHRLLLLRHWIFRPEPKT